MTREAWLEAHSYLQPVAEFCDGVERAAAEIEGEKAEVPSWSDYDSDFRAGVPLIQSVDAAIDLEPVGKLIVSLVRKLARDSSSEKIKAEAAALAAQIDSESDFSRRVVTWLLGDEAFTPASAGLLRYLGWTAMSWCLLPVVKAFDRWRDEDRWLRKYCPTCGSAPAMAQLMGTDPGRMRFLSCGRCGTRWRYTRTACPFCENDSQRLAVLAVEGEEGLRVDYCESCKGYLKTYDGQGNEAMFLSDWTSLHLDLVAQDRGLKRLAASLYDFDPARDQ